MSGFAQRHRERWQRPNLDVEENAMERGQSRLPALPTILSVNAGYVDTAGFLALHGLFTSHVTGNFVTLGAALVQGTTGATAKLLALPVFCAAIFGVRLLHYGLERRGLPSLGTMLALKFGLLLAAAILATLFGPFPDGDAFLALVTGMLLVIAMAIQNGAHRVHLSKAPPSTVMTGTTTQVMLDLADLFHGIPADAKAALRPRLIGMLVSVIAFAAGCSAAALLYFLCREWAFAIPPILAFLSLLRHNSTAEPDGST
jgi:uncharacterized membrane protein YoaK (UPF0700 family)